MGQINSFKVKSPLLHRFRKGFTNLQHNKEWNLFRLRGMIDIFLMQQRHLVVENAYHPVTAAHKWGKKRKMCNYLALCSVFIDVVHKEFMFICGYIFCCNTSMMPAQKTQTEVTFGSLRSLQANSSRLNMLKRFKMRYAPNNLFIFCPHHLPLLQIY